MKGSSSKTIILNSPIAIKEADFTCVRLHYSLQKSTNVDVTLSMWAQYYDVPLVPGVFDWTNKNCTSCSVEVDVYGDEQHATMVKYEYLCRRFTVHVDSLLHELLMLPNVFDLHLLLSASWCLWGWTRCHWGKVCVPILTLRSQFGHITMTCLWFQTC